MQKIYIILFTACLIISSCGTEEDTPAPPSNIVQTPEPVVETPSLTQYTLTVTAGDGGTVSTEGGAYNEGTQVTVTALPDEGYGFLGWEGDNSDSSSLNLTINADTTIQALFAELPALVLPSLPSKMFTKGVADTLLFSFSSSAGYKSVDIQSELGSVEIIQEPEVGIENGDVIIQYTPNSIGNVNHMITIAGHDDINISIIDQNDLEKNETYRIRTQPEPKHKNYLKPSQELVKSDSKVNIGQIRYLNQRDNLISNFCSGIFENYNIHGNPYDEPSSSAFADINGDGYDDILIQPVFTNTGIGISSVGTEYEIYIYENGEYKFYPIDFGGKTNLKIQLARKILVGDFDNDGDADFYSANFGLDAPPYSEEPSYFLINNYSVDGTFDYKLNPHIEGVHEASAADIDNDGDLDIFSIGRRKITTPSVPLYRNDGNFNFTVWNDFFELNGNNELWFFVDYVTSELVDIDKDGFVDLVLTGHEWERFNDNCAEYTDNECGRSTIIWGSNSGFNTNTKSYLPIISGFETAVDIKSNDIDNDGINEIIIVRTGGGDFVIDEQGQDINDANQETSFYGGWYIQIIKVLSRTEIVDITNDIIDSYYSNETKDYCGLPENEWIYKIIVGDYDNDGNLDIYNRMQTNRPLHRWEWNGSRFVKISP